MFPAIQEGAKEGRSSPRQAARGAVGEPRPKPTLSVIGLTTDLANNPSELARLIDSDLECLGAKLGDFGRRDT